MPHGSATKMRELGACPTRADADADASPAGSVSSAPLPRPPPPELDDTQPCPVSATPPRRLEVDHGADPVSESAIMLRDPIRGARFYVEVP